MVGKIAITGTDRRVTPVGHDDRTGRHTSRSDRANHATTRLKTVIQTANGQHQVAHIYLDANYTYTGHALYPNEKND